MSSFVARRTGVLIPIKDSRCGHCGNDTTWELHEPYTLAEAYPHGTDEVSQYKVYSTLLKENTNLLLRYAILNQMHVQCWLGVH
jgi:hypothetical protein